MQPHEGLYRVRWQRIRPLHAEGLSSTPGAIGMEPLPIPALAQHVNHTRQRAARMVHTNMGLPAAARHDRCPEPTQPTEALRSSKFLQVFGVPCSKEARAPAAKQPENEALPPTLPCPALPNHHLTASHNPTHQRPSSARSSSAGRRSSTSRRSSSNSSRRSTQLSARPCPPAWYPSRGRRLVLWTSTMRRIAGHAELKRGTKAKAQKASICFYGKSTATSMKKLARLGAPADEVYPTVPGQKRHPSN